jgi:predicted transporter
VELKSLWLGLLVSMLAFSVKTGLGWSYMWLRCPPGRRAWATLGVMALYLALFGGVLALVSRINILGHYQVLAPLWQGGITLHWLVAAFLVLWGLMLLRSDGEGHASATAGGASAPGTAWASQAAGEQGWEVGGSACSGASGGGASASAGGEADEAEASCSTAAGGSGASASAVNDGISGAGASASAGTRGAIPGSGPQASPTCCGGGGGSTKAWLALVIPCPVCLSIILMALAGLVLYFPDNALAATGLLYLAFLGVAGGAGLGMILGRGGDSEPLEHTLGLVMILIAAYFILSALVMPQFSDVGRVYRIASYAKEDTFRWGAGAFALLSSLAVLLTLGFFLGRRDSRRSVRA